MKYLFFIFAVFLFACVKLQKQSQSVKYYISNGGGLDFDVVLIDSCEYLVYAPGSNYGMITHKGNCSKCIHSFCPQISPSPKETSNK